MPERPRGRPALPPLLLAVAAVALLAACAHQPAVGAYVRGPGFWRGLVHGAIAPFALVGSLFTDVRVYAWPNRGPWYDFGFLLGIAAWAGGAASRRR